MTKKRVVQINAYYRYGSTGKIVEEIEREGIKHGFEMYSIYWLLNENITDKNVFYCGKKKNKSQLNKIIQWVFKGGKLSYNTEVTKKIIMQIYNIKPDVIHLHNLHGDFEFGMLDIPYFFNELSKLKVKIIWTIHDCWPITGRCYHFSYSGCEKWKENCGKCPQKFYDREGILKDYSRYNLGLKKQLYNKINDLTIITVSKWLEFEVKKSILKDRKIFTVYNGIDTSVFIPNKKITENKKFRILCIGWDRRKGYKDYFKLSKMLDKDEEILIVGKRPFFRRFRKLPNNIKTIPYINNNTKLAELYRSADVYFNSSIAETFGLTTAEAISCGLPVIGYNSTATPEIIGIAGCCGFLVPLGNVKDVYDKIKLIKNCENYNNLEAQEIRYKSISNTFDKYDMIKKYLNIYNNI